VYQLAWPFRAAILLVLSAQLTACGFQLRGVGDNAAELPDEWKRMHLVTGNPNGEFSREVQGRFAAHGIEWTERQSANYLLKLGPERFSQRNLSLNSEARVAEFELTMRARFSVDNAGNQAVIESTEVTTIRQMENDPRNVVGKAEEIRILKAEMRADLARQIMRRIGFFAISSS
jgi:LPS-assembly lipoprotein